MSSQFVEAISNFLTEIECGDLSEQQVSSMMSDLRLFAPHSDLSDIIFYGERNRTPEEIVNEALLRERIWEEGGREAVTAHVKALMLAALADPAIDTTHRYSAMNILEGIEREAGRRQPS
ncbi:MAG: hypothetical protein K2P58_02575 [Hyphomonadaceae bacterium]|nr:hypothetical protein [Hyphomonadaceae bacterium]